MADRIVLMRGGHIEQIGTPLELYDRPGSTFVAQFIGSPTMNMLHGKAKLNNAGFVLETEERMHFPLPGHANLQVDQPIILGRPA